MRKFFDRMSHCTRLAWRPARGTLVLFLLLGGCATGAIPESHEGRHVVIGHGVEGPRTLLLQPVSGARLSSTFGTRRDPFTGERRPHNGIDYAAPVGAPVQAAGDGTVVSAGRRGTYGHYVRIRHDDRHQTAYGHLSSYADHLGRGVRVTQGEVIGYVGSSGRSTGPHLHYEVLKNDDQINPMNLKHPPTAQLKGEELEQFEAEMARIDRTRRDYANGTLVAGKMNAPGG